MNKEMQDALIRNLKLLNAKERDLLMRHAYLGIENQSALSASFDNKLKDLMEQKLKLPKESARCVFAGMDYHLDWLFAALWMATQNLKPESAGRNMDVHTSIEGLASKYTEFRTVTGIQEDVDLLVVYEVKDELVLLFIEAKGSAAFDRVQLARKLIRLDRILVDSVTHKDGKYPLRYLFVMASPDAPDFKDFKHCKTFAAALPSPTKFDTMRRALTEQDGHKSGVGNDLHHLSLDGFPDTLYAVLREREKPTNKNGDYTRWRLEARARPAKDNQRKHGRHGSNEVAP